jgi:hypothetical protein
MEVAKSLRFDRIPSRPSLQDMEGDGETAFRDECVASMVGGAERLDPCYPYMPQKHGETALLRPKSANFTNAIERS